MATRFSAAYVPFLIIVILAAPAAAGVILPGGHGAQCSSDLDCNTGMCCVTGAAELQYNSQCHRTYNKHGGVCIGTDAQNQFAYIPDTEPVGCKVKVTFQWITAPGTTKQYLEINSVNDFSSCGTGICKRVDVTGKNPYTMDSGLTSNNQYYWRIVADVSGARKQSIVASFISPECSSTQCMSGSCIDQSTPRPTCTQRHGAGYVCKLGEKCTGSAESASGTNCEGQYSGDEVCCKPAVVTTTLPPRTTTVPLCTSNSECDDNSPCTLDRCKGSDIGCIYENLPAGQSCGTGKMCDGRGNCIDQSTPKPSCADRYGIGYSCKKFQLCNEEIQGAAGTNCEGAWGGDEICCGPSTSPGCKQLYLDKTSSSVVPSYIMSGKKYTLYCDFGERVDCISPSGSCRWVGWTGTAATYECDAPVAPDNYDIYCGSYATAANCCPLPQTEAYRTGILHVSASCVFNADCPSDNNPCTSTVCKEELEMCIYPARAAGTSCGNGGTCDRSGNCVGETVPPQPPSTPPTTTCWTPSGWMGGSMNNLVEGTGLIVQPGGSYTMTCNYGRSNVACVYPSSACNNAQFVGWLGTAAKFSCTAPADPGSYDMYCTTGAGTPSNCCGGQSNKIGTLTVPGAPATTTTSTTTTTTILSKPLLCGDYGDVDDDNAITSKDQLAVLQKSAGITPKPFYADRADVDKDGDIDGADALKIGRYLIGSDTFFATCPRPPCNSYGDVNNDGYVTYIDALFIGQYTAGLKPSPFYTDRADVDGNGKIDSVDNLAVQKYLAGTGSLLICGAAATTTSTSTTISGQLRPPCGNYGDVDGDGFVTSTDSLFVQRYVAGLNPSPFFTDRADVDGNTKIDAVDSLKILRYVAKLDTTFPACS